MKQEAMPLRRPNLASPEFVPYELIVEIFTTLSVKPLIRFTCLNRFFKTLITDPHFVQMHLNKSSQNSQLAIIDDERSSNFSLVTLSIPRLLQNQFDTIHHSGPCYPLDSYLRIVGSCDGLLCLIAFSYSSSEHQWLCFWNPATRTKSEYFRLLPDFPFLKFSFGYDISTRTYKVVAFNVEVKPGYNPKSVVNVFSLGDNSWKNIQCLPVLPLYSGHHNENNGVHLNGTINWLGLGNYTSNNGVTFDQNVILSLDLSTETYTQFLVPQIFDNNMLRYHPIIVVLMGCLCFCHSFKGNIFIIWQMKDFGVQDSWIQLFKISYDHSFGYADLLPLYLSKNGDTLILANEIDETFIYNRRDNKIEQTGTTNDIMWCHATNYVESLVSPH